MAEPTFAYGYSGARLTIAQLETKQTVYKLHPEFWRRYKALIRFAATQGVVLGVGTGWRIQPNPPPPGFAAPGNSNHEGFPADGKTGGAVAIDTVPGNSWAWMERNLKAYGLRSFKQPSTNGYTGKNEPWHIQPAEIPAGRNHRTTPWKLNTFPLPPGSGPPPPPPPTPTPTWAQDLMRKLPVLTPGGVGVPVKRMQHFLALAGEFSATNTANFDGKYGSGTQTALNRFKASHKLAQDSRCDATVWSLFCAAGDGLPTLKKGAAGTDVQRMQRMLSANGFMDPANQANFDGQFGSGTDSALRNFQTKRQLVVDGVCAAAVVDESAEWLMFKGRSVTDVMVLAFTFLVAFAIAGLTLMIIVVKLRDPRANLDRSIDALASFLSAILGALLGLIAGKRSANGTSPPVVTEPPSDKEG